MGVSLAFQRRSSSPPPHLQLCRSIPTMRVSTSLLLVCFPKWEGLAMCQSSATSLLPAGNWSAGPCETSPCTSGSASKTTAKIWACFPGWWRWVLYSHWSLRWPLRSLLRVLSGNLGYLVIYPWLGWQTLSGYCPHLLRPLPISVHTSSSCVFTPAAST